MLAEPVIRALRAHVRLIEQFEADYARERARLWEPQRARMLELYYFVFGHGFPNPDPLSERRAAREAREGIIHGHILPPLDGHALPVHDAHDRGIVASVIVDSPDKERGRREIDEISAGIKVGLARFAAAHRPDVEPYDTPSELVEDIDEALHSIERIRRHMETTDSGRAIIAKYPDRFPPRPVPDLPAPPEDKIRIIYREARRRALAFEPLVPAVLGQFPEPRDLILGLQDIQSWFAAVDRTLRSPGPVEADSGPAEGAATGKVGVKHSKTPSRAAFAAYRLYVEEGLKQASIAQKLEKEFSIPVDQSKVSRWVAIVRKYREAGYPLPKPKTISMDPGRLEQGRRRDGRRGPQ